MNGEQKFKEGDGLRQSFETSYQRRGHVLHGPRAGLQDPAERSLTTAKASVLGDYLPIEARHGRGGERRVHGAPRRLQRLHMLFFFENGKAARVELCGLPDDLATARGLTGAYSDKSPVVHFMVLSEEREIVR